MCYKLLNKKYTETTFAGEILNWNHKWVIVDFTRCSNGEKVWWCRKDLDGFNMETTEDEEIQLEKVYQKFIREEKLNRIIK